MIAFLVITALFAFFIFLLIQILIQEWLDGLSMKRLSLKRSFTGRTKNETPSMMHSIKTIEISDDDDDISDVQSSVIEDEAGSTSALNNAEYPRNVEQNVEKDLSQDASSSSKVLENLVTIHTKNKNLNLQNPMFMWSKNEINTRSNYENYKAKKLAPVNSYSSNECDDSNKFLDIKQENKKLKMSEDEDKVLEENPQHKLKIGGIEVTLPVKPYSCQIAVMNQIIQCSIKKENCLIESPTGSGKTLALLCGALAWQSHYGEQLRMEWMEKARGKNNSNSEEDSKDDKLPSPPKIYYGTRTHKQIEQVVRELKKTIYRNKRMTILSSREITCIQDSHQNKTELCNSLLDPTKKSGPSQEGCAFYNDKNKKITDFNILREYGMTTPWDIEDLVSTLKQKRSCPYFAARNLMPQAEIIFCPYNYLIDPDIRESMQIVPNGQIIILDEAHNIEDFCRDVASIKIQEDCLNGIVEETKKLGRMKSENPYQFKVVKDYILSVLKFLQMVKLDKESLNSDNLVSSYWTGSELREVLVINDITAKKSSSFIEASEWIINNSEKFKEDLRNGSSNPNIKSFKDPLPVLMDTTKRTLEHLMCAIRMIDSQETADDYRACVTETTFQNLKFPTDNVWVPVNNKDQRMRTLKLLCMNPGVTFAPLASSTRSIILASGTLTPTATFEGELRTKFAHKLHASHVIPKEQVYATCIPRGPNGISLKANYHNVNSWSFQDELGFVLYDVCQTVPHGILCFFSSYSVMNTQIERWRQKPLWNKITSLKQVFVEPRCGNDMTSIMIEYRKIIQSTCFANKGDINGAIFFAVFRGKIAEGIDFTDNEARCVITVGIPYAVMKDPTTDMKIKYNDKNVSKGLLSGREWYSIQAFRALNQALGRCVRHVNDWGAVLLVDERFMGKENINRLPKWIKSMWTHESAYNLKEKLSYFVSKRKARDLEN